MTALGWLQIALIFALVLVCVKPLGLFMARLFSSEHTFLTPVLGGVERGFYRLAGIDPQEGAKLARLHARDAGVQRGRLCSFSTACMRLQAILPLNPQGFDRGPRPISPSTRRSASSPTPTGSPMAARPPWAISSRWPDSPSRTSCRRPPASRWRLPFVRAFARSGATTVGNFWVDLTRTTLYVLLPLSIVLALVFLIARHAADAAGLGRRHDARRRQADHRARPGRLARRRSSSSAPTAAASSTPTPRIRSRTRTPSANILSIWSMLLIAAALPYTFGRMVGDTRQGWALLSAMLAILLAGVCRRLLGGGATATRS